MKKLCILFFAILFVFAINACKGHSHDHGEGHSHDETSTENVDKSGKEYTSAYVCPMHCKGSGSEEAGKCPVCGMDYVTKESLENDGDGDGHNHEHDGDGDGHNHEHDGHNHDH